MNSRQDQDYLNDKIITSHLMRTPMYRNVQLYGQPLYHDLPAVHRPVTVQEHDRRDNFDMMNDRRPRSMPMGHDPAQIRRNTVRDDR